MPNTGDFHWSFKVESASKITNTLVEDNERFYSSRFTFLCEAGKFESVLEAMGNMENLKMVSRVFVDKMLETISEIADVVGYKSE